MLAAMKAAALAVPLSMCVSCSGATTSGADEPDRARATAATPPTPARPTPAASADPEPTPREGALLAFADARFYTWSDRQRPRWAGAPIDRDEPPQRIVPLRVVASRGDYYEVILGAAPPGTCFGDLPSLGGVTMRLWMHRRDVIPSLTAPLTRTYADGTSIQIAPGVAVTANDGGALTLRSRYVTVALRASDAIVGEVFAPPARRPEPEGAERFLTGHGVHLQLGPMDDRSVAIVSHPTAARSGHDIEISELIETKERVARVKVEDPCVTLVARVPEENLARQGTVWGMGGVCNRTLRPAYRIEPGTELFFPDGERAGTTTERQHVEVRNADWGERACFMLALDPVCPGEDEGIELCARRDALVPAK